MTPQQFIAKWKKVDLSERSACQQHFLDLCELLNQPKPAEVDPKGHWFTFEKGVEKTGGGKGFADVWLQDKFGWEYKGKHKNLKAAYDQLLKYREALENPPLLIVCDLDRFEIHTNFTGTVKKVHAFDLDRLADPANILLLRQVFTNPDALKPGKTREAVTEEAADRFARLADGMARRGLPSQQAAHFLMKLMFCMFAEDIELLPRDLFTKTVTNSKSDPARLSKLLKNLFECMAKGEPFGADAILRFNGGLFADSDTFDLTPDEIDELLETAHSDWSNVEPSIFGTLFERTLDPDKRAQIGAHYTSRGDIETLLKPVLFDPLKREWEVVKAQSEKLWEKVQAKARVQDRKSRKDSKERQNFDKCLERFADRLAHVTVLDPACGSGNFLYVAINLLLDLEKEVITYAVMHDTSRFPHVRPTQLRGLEVNPYAQQLAQVVLWIGYLQWMHFNGYQPQLDPVLEPFESIRHADAILDRTDPANPTEPEWPEAEFIVGNPPFLGGNRMRRQLGEEYVEALFRLYKNRVPGFADLCCYWFEKVRSMVGRRIAKRTGLVATQSIRGGVNRRVLERIKETGDIFFAISDRDWILDGASVHISMVGFDDGTDVVKTLDGGFVDTIHATLAAGLDTTVARIISSNQLLHIEGVKKGAKFELETEDAEGMLTAPNPHGKPNSDVVRLYFNGADLTQTREIGWIVYFPAGTLHSQASLYELPFSHVERHVYPIYGMKRAKWWQHERPRPEMSPKLCNLARYLCVVKHSKHCLFTWVPSVALVSNAIEVFFREDDYIYGIVHSHIHELWAHAPGRGTQVRERESGFRYTPTTCFDTFPFPDPTAEQRVAIAVAAKELDALRNNWLNPPEWVKTETLEFPGSVDGPWKRFVFDSDNRGIGTVRYPRIVAKDDPCAAKLKMRTLTNLYNEMPTWLKNAHAKLNEAVFDAYGWPADLGEDDLLARLLALNLSRSVG